MRNVLSCSLCCLYCRPGTTPAYARKGGGSPIVGENIFNTAVVKMAVENMVGKWKGFYYGTDELILTLTWDYTSGDMNSSRPDGLGHWKRPRPVISRRVVQRHGSTSSCWTGLNWRKVIHHRRDYLNDHCKLWSVYQIAKPFFLEAAKDSGVKGRMIEMMDGLYAVLVGTHPGLAVVMIDKAYQYAGQCFYFYPHGVSAQYGAKEWHGCNTRANVVWGVQQDDKYQISDIYDFFLRRENQGGPQLIKVYERIIVDLSQALADTE